jgi:adenylate kinase family enzyme
MKIYIVGAVASGKSTFARQLSGHLEIPYYSLDEIVHIPDKSNPWGDRKRTVEERDNLFYSIINQNDWIVEDTGRPCFEEALKVADTIILLEISAKTRKFRIIERWIKQRLRIEQCSYKPRYKMLKCMLQWSKDYDAGRDDLKGRIVHYEEKVIIIRNNKDIKEFLMRYNKIS